MANTHEEELIARSWNRELFLAWKNDEITWEEAVFLARRVEFHYTIRRAPPIFIRLALRFYDFLYEP